jgi:hypothetical protein
MSRHVDWFVATATATAIGAAALSGAQAQTIGDYSRAQRAVIESTIARSSSRPAGPGPVGLPTLPPAGASAPGFPLPSGLSNSVARSDLPGAPQVSVTGVIVTSARTVAEVQVDGVPYLLDPGEPVPGTPWSVVHVADDRVVLREAAGAKGTRTFLFAKVGP